MYFGQSLRNVLYLWLTSDSLSRTTFDKVVKILSRNPIFTSKGKKPQRHIKWQLGCFLIRYGQYGSPITDTMLKTGIGYGTVILYCRRVIRALRELRSNFGGWMTDVEQSVTEERILHRIGFPKCLGSADGSLIQTTNKPRQDGPAYLTRKGFFGFAVQATVDAEIWFTSWELGWPGSVTDARVFKNSHIWLHRNQYLKDGHYILADKGDCTSILVFPLDMI
ncbi:uncharacterized protein SCHCODRAFT_02513710 [Schizophyllum commune H4-8]|uniref:uncharacterized protein n=1 Tax=Schizophyllum commune (strain H4-8 / FGSC 9210) TaxID=578458 RepID=UPI00215F9A44|nr:uncharacterized protein SCHCODRAFT_02513710 [Schizophyllum commune H4-8]KAI5888409.1 hypothetical protein SCHCODRAFT_02513710 [Schizophyllum commune H4-8]